MPVETATDRAIILSDFGLTATYTPVGGAAKSITVIFDNDYYSADGSGSVAFAMTQPKAQARTLDLTGVVEGASLVIEGVSYIIRVVMPDGTGMTEVMLEVQ
tara:strand:- start:108 stop:413 length:306 start_codon:yes stop_codon:yes gene_type:complete